MSSAPRTDTSIDAGDDVTLPASSYLSSHMPSSLDTALRFPHVHVIPASAGSGKTYALSHRYVQFLLSDVIPSAGFRNILAITFTKLAAKEMKERIVLLLKQIALGDAKAVQGIVQQVALPPEVLMERAGQLVDRILHHYSDFNVRTIDSFLTTVFKASAMELGVLPNVEMEFDHDAVIQQAFRQYSQQLREGSDAARFIDDLVRLIESNDSANGGFLWNPFTKMVREVRGLQKEFGRFAHDPIVTEGRGALTELEQRIVSSSQSLKTMLEKSTLPVSSYFQKDVTKLAAGDVFTVAGKGKWKKYFNKYSEDAAAEKEVKRLFAVVRPLERDLEAYLILYSKSYYQPFVKAVALIADAMREVKLLSGTVVIDDVNRSLARYLSGNVVPEVYLKLGERIAHFMIDEFQDTSPIQWQNLSPLIEEALSKEGSLFAVGDTKQSIYGFRGADWRIFRNLREGRYFPSAPPEELPLTTNYRSAQALVEFVRTVFSANIAAAGMEEYARASGLYEFAQEVPEHERGKGYVEVRRIVKNDEKDGDRPHREFLIGVIRDCLSRGYSYRDIAILTPANADVVEMSSWLNREGIPFLSLSTLDIRKRKIISELIALLRFLDAPIDDLSFFTFLSGTVMQRSVPTMTAEAVHAFAAECRTKRIASDYRLFRERFPDVWERYFDRLFALVGYMPLYDLVSEVYKTFSVFASCSDEESSLVKLLECVKQFERTGTNSLKDFLSFSTEESADTWSIDVPQSIDAVQVMTVHKAKGLGFPVVFVSLSEKRPVYRSLFTQETDAGVEVMKISKGYGERSEQLGAYYQEKEEERIIDDLNKIYVALTRARKEMYVSVLYKKEENLPACILPETVIGERYAIAEHARAEEGLPMVASLYRNEGIDVPTASFKKIGIEETHRGDVVHAVLSGIESIDGPDADAVATGIAMLDAAIRTEGEAEKDAMTAFLAVPEIGGYFQRLPGRTILREEEFVAPNGRLYRMDRVVVDADAVTVVDFKTGSDEHHDEYCLQVKNYINLLRDIYPGRTVTGALLYYDLRKGVPVL